jgi:hypothetical protein
MKIIKNMQKKKIAKIKIKLKNKYQELKNKEMDLFIKRQGKELNDMVQRHEKQIESLKKHYEIEFKNVREHERDKYKVVIWERDQEIFRLTNFVKEHKDRYQNIKDRDELQMEIMQEVESKYSLAHKKLAEVVQLINRAQDDVNNYSIKTKKQNLKIVEAISD